MVSAAARRPARMSLTNLDTGEGFFCQFNPTQWEEQVGVNWNRQNVPGLSHQPLQYGFTENMKVSLDLFARGEAPGEVNQSAVKDKDVKGLAGILDFRKFLMSLVYPRQSSTVGGAGPPRILLVWPNVLTLNVIATSYKVQHSRFNIQGTTVEYVATMGFEELRDTRITSEQVRILGAERQENPGDL